MGVGGGVSGRFGFAIQAVGLGAYPLDAACEADAVVGGEGDVGVDQPIVARFEGLAVGQGFAAVGAVGGGEGEDDGVYGFVGGGTDEP